MPAGYNGTGIYLRAYDWTTDKTAGVKIQAVRMDEEMDGISAALSNCICRDGQSTIVANIPMGANKLTGLGPGTMAGDSVRYEQVALLGGNQTVSGNNTFTGTNIFTGTTPPRFVNTADSAGVQVARFEGDRASFADNDNAYNSYYLSNDGGTQVEVGRFTWQATDVNAATGVDGTMLWGVMVANTLTTKLLMDGVAMWPAVNAGLRLGYGTAAWNGLYLATDTLISWNNDQSTLSHSSSLNRLTISTATELHVPGTFYATGNAVIGDQPADSVTIKGTAVHAEVSGQLGATWVNFGKSLLDAQLTSRVAAAGDIVVFRQQHSTFSYGYQTLVGFVQAGLLGLPQI